MKGNHQITLFSPLFQHLKSSHATLLFIIFAELVTVGYIALSSLLGESFHRPTPSPIVAHKLPTLQCATHQHAHRYSSLYDCNVTGVKSWKKGMVTLLQPRIEANCTALRTGDEGELRTVKKRIRTWVNSESDEEFLKTLSNCSHIVEEYSSNFYVSPEEENFPLAYILVVYTNVRQVLRLLKVIYRPHNLYCIHPDAKAPNTVSSFQAISHCLDNVFVASKLEKVYYAHHTILDAQLNCMQDLMGYNPSRWRYTINLCGRELPLRTNREIVQSLVNLNGSSAVDSFEVPESDGHTVYKYLLSAGVVKRTQMKLGPVPYGIKLYKSITYIATSRPFVSFLLTDIKSTALRKYLEDARSSEEHFYSTLYKLPGVPGGPPNNSGVVPVVDACTWLYSKYAKLRLHEMCKGRIAHGVCILSIGDLPMVYSKGVNAHRPTFFFNKYFMEWDHVVMDCMEQRIVEQNILEYQHDCSLYT